MALGNEPRLKKTYLSINHGEVVKNTPDGKEFFSFVEGFVKDIYSKERTFNGASATFWYIDLQDDQNLFSLCLPHESGVFVSIILSLASEEDIKGSMVKIEPYKGANNYTRVKVFSNGARLQWITQDLPPVEDVMVGNKVVKDNSKRMAYIEYLVSSINNRIKK